MELKQFSLINLLADSKPIWCTHWRTLIASTRERRLRRQHDIKSIINVIDKIHRQTIQIEREPNECSASASASAYKFI